MQKEIKEFIKNVLIILAIMAAICLLCVVTSCNAGRVAQKYYRKNLDKLAIECAERFPAQESIVVRDTTLFDTVLIEAEGRTDTVTIEGHTVYLSRPCPPHKVITKTVKKDSIVTKESGPVIASLRFQLGAEGKRVDKLQQELQQAKTDGEKWKAQRNKLRWILYALAGGFLVWLYFKVRLWRPFFNGVGK